VRYLICILVAIYGTAVIAETKSIEERVTQAIVVQTNEFRKSKELDPVDRNDSLTRSAKTFAEFMAKTDRYGHRADGRSPAERAEAAGYDYCVVRENIAYRTNTGEISDESLTDVFVSGWIDSPSHRENMLADYVTETGVAVASSDGVTYYAVQLFGRPESLSYRIEITNRSDVVETLVIRANDEKSSLELRPQMILKFTRCFPSLLSLKGSEASLSIRSSTKLTIDEGQLSKHED